MKHILLACVLILSLGFNSYGQASADPGLSPIFFTTLSNNPLAANALPLNSGFKINLPFFNLTPGVALPAGSCKIKIGLGSKMGINPGFNVATAAYSQYFSWTLALAGGQWEITGSLIADLPGGFSGTAVFEVTGTLVGNSTATANFLVTNHSTITTLSDTDGTNNNSTAAYTVVSLLSISINQGTSITVCQNAALTLTTTTVGTGPFTYSWNNGLGTASSATPPTTAVGTTSYTVTVTDAASNTANASISVTVSGPSTITASAGANGAISSSGATSVNCGTNKTYTITPNTCYHVLDVLVDGVSVGAVTSYTFNNVTANHTIAASFAINTYTITVSAGANGTITPGTGTVNCGSNNAYTIAANTCYHIVDVTLDGVSQGAVSTVNVNNVTANHTIAASFAINTYTITVSAGANGTITPGTGTVNCGSNNAYTIAANTCYHIVDVTLDGVSQGAVSTVNVNNVTANHTIVATFAINTYTITVSAGANGTITPGTGTVNCGSNNAYTIAANICYHIVDVTLDGVSQGAVSTVNVNNVTANHTITATFAINTYTITASAGANGNISSSGATSVNCGTNKTYTITPNTCYHVLDVLVDGVSVGAVTSYTFNNVTANHTIAATFAINTYTITVSTGANGTITPGTGTVNCGSNNAYTIAANACYHIVDVTLDGVSQGVVSTVNVNNVTANHTITASFAINTYTITASAGANGTISSTGATSVNCGMNKTYTITPNSCYHVLDVLVDGVSQGAITSYSFNNITANHTISATFAINTYTITITPGANGTITPGTGIVNCGSNNAYTIAANACYHIVDVTLDGVSQGAVSTVNVNNVTANHTIAATFAINTYTITASAGANGTISSTGATSVNCGTNKTYTITPNACYHVLDVLVDGVSQGAITSYSFNNITANHTISATFAINTYTITVSAGANGTITPGTGTVNCGSNNAYTIAANTCYHIVDVTLDGVSQGAVSTVNVNNVTANHTIAASFAINTYTITVSAGANGTITPGTGTVNCGSNNAYTIAANTCYHIVDVTLDGISQGAVSTVNVNNVTANHTIAATFAINTYTITVSAGANGTITPGTGTVNCGSNNAYTIAANACYHIVDVTLDGVSQGAVSTVNVNNVTANHTITASFAINTYTITVTQTANGTISPATGTVNCGSNNTYTITPASCYQVVDVIVDGISQGAITSYAFNNVTANHTMTATYAVNPYNITVTQTANGTISPGTTSVNCGGNQSFSIAAAACYHIVDVAIDGISQGAITSYAFTNVQTNHTITATYAINIYNISITQTANGTITPAIGTVNCGSNSTYTITAASCYHIVDVVVDGISQGAITNYAFTNVQANHTITATYAINPYNITVTQTANGTISPATGTVNCGTNNTYTITPAACYQVVDVVVDAVSQGAITSYSFNNVTANHTITATFAINPYTLTVTQTANGAISPGTTSVNCGGNQSFSIVADACYHIVDVVVDGLSQGTVSNYSFTNVQTNHTITASFAINTYTITVNAGANGTITPGTGTVNCGSNNAYTIAANTCYHIVDVTLDGVSQGAVSTVNVNNVAANHTIAASFAINTYTITVSAGANGTITPGTGTVNCGSNNAYTIAANTCYHIVDVTLDGVPQGAVSTVNVNNVAANHTIAASFAINTYTITVSAGTNGTITPGTGTLNCGSNNAYTIAANTCYHIVDVTLDGVSQGAVSTVNVNNVTANHTIAATFAINTYTITVSAGANGTITPGTGTVNCGSNNTYTIAANICYHIVDVTLDGVSQGAVSTVNVNNVTANHTIAATFAINTYTITVSAGINGTITPGTGTVNCGSNNAYTIAANACYHIVDVLVDGVSQGAVSTVNVNNITANHTIAASFAGDIIPVPSVVVVDNCDGTSTLTASGYTGTLLWNDAATENPHIVNLAGTYTVTQTIGTCTSDPSTSVTANPGTLANPSLVVTQPACATPTGTITINAPTGAGISYSINGIDYSNITGVFGSLAPGSYNVTAKAAAGCISGITVAVVDPKPSAAGINVSSVVNNTCHGGSTGTITVVGNGATGPYTYSILSGPTINTTGSSSGIFTGLTAGSYVLAVSPAAGCSNSVAASVTQPNGIFPDITAGADYTGNFFAVSGDENTLIYNISEIGGNPAVGDTLRITRVPGYNFVFNVAATSIVNGSVNYILDNARWKLDNSNAAFISLVFDPGNNNVPGTLNCSERIYLSVGLKRATFNISTFTLTARLRRTNDEQSLSNNLAPVLFTAE